MVKHSKTLSGNLLAFSILGLTLCAVPSRAQTPPELKVSDGTNYVIVDSTGASYYGGTCSATACPGTVNTANSTTISWSGTVGAFTVTSASGQVLGTPDIDLGLASVTTASSSANLYLSFTSQFSSGTGPFNIAVTGAASSGSYSFSTYLASTPFGTTQQIGPYGLEASTLYSATPASNPFYETIVATVSGLAPNFDAFTFGTASTTSPCAGGTSTATYTFCKSASTNSVSLAPGSSFPLITYTYTVTNPGTSAISDVVVTDDNATPGYTPDDWTFTYQTYTTPPPNTTTVACLASIAPGGSCTFTWQTYTPIATMVLDDTLGAIPGGTLIIQNENVGPQGAGCTPNSPSPGSISNPCYLKFVLNQSTNLNDNTYGSNASYNWTHKTSGPSGHQFSDLTGSDQAWFYFYDTKGNAVLEDDEDYISQASTPDSGCPWQMLNGTINTSSYPSGYGTLGWCGGDGKWIGGSASDTYIVSHDSTLTDDLNQSSEFHQYTTNSPASTSADYANWNIVDGYTVVVNPQAFGTNGFGWVTNPLIHNSPSMNGTDQVSNTPGCSSATTPTCAATNTATATGSGITSGTAMATVVVSSTYTVAAPSGAGGPAPGGPAPGGPAPGGPAAGGLTVTFVAGPAANGTVGTPYNESFTATGGTGPYTFTVTTGTLPAGLTLNPATGAVTGTPTTMTSGPAPPLTVTVTDSKKDVATANFNINITAAPPAPPTPPGPPTPPTPPGPPAPPAPPGPPTP